MLGGGGMGAGGKWGVVAAAAVATATSSGLQSRSSKNHYEKVYMKLSFDIIKWKEVRFPTAQRVVPARPS